MGTNETPDKQRVADTTESAHRGLVALDVISQLLTVSAFDLPMLLNEIVRITAERLHVKASALRLVDEETGQLVLQAVHGLSPRFLTEGPVFDTESRFQRLIQNRGLLDIHDVRQEPDLHFSQATLAEGISSLLATGLYWDDQIIGALSVYTETPHHFTESEVRTLRVMANQSVVAFRMAQLHEAQMQKEWLERELDLASDIQAQILPEAIPPLEGMHLVGWSQPWEQVGGDFYDFITLPEDNLGIAIGDVSGKSIPAALLMFTVRMALRAHVEHEYAVSKIMHLVNRALYRDTQLNQFATLFYGVLHVPTRRFTYVNASHNPPLLLRGDKILTLETGGLPVGMLPEETYEEEAVQLLPGDLLVFYTDGYTDIAGEGDDVFGEERFHQYLQEHRHEDAEQLIQTLEQIVSTYLDASDHGDDRTLVVLKVDADGHGAL